MPLKERIPRIGVNAPNFEQQSLFCPNRPANAESGDDVEPAVKNVAVCVVSGDCVEGV